MGRKRRRKVMPEIAHAPQHWDEVLEREFKGESDRACVILAAALLDSALETFLRSFLLPASTADDPLFDGPTASLATFSARIEMAYRLGLIDAAFAKNLHLARKIRNDFAHNIAGCTFADSSVMGRLTELRRSSGIPATGKSIRDCFPDGARGDFQFIVSWLQWSIRYQCESIRPLTAENAMPGWTDLDKDEPKPKNLKRPSKTQPALIEHIPET